MTPFVKAFGLGNDFVIFNTCKGDLSELSKKVSNRRYGIGCDQVIFIQNEKENDYFVRFFNPDGSEAEACGNGTRCVSKWLMQKKNIDSLSIKTLGGSLQCRLEKNGKIEVDFPLPHLQQNILYPEIHGYCDAAYIGNPHLVCFTDRGEELEVLAPEMEHHPKFPNRTNVDFAHIISSSCIKLRVWERGTGITPACGTGALATAYAAFKRGLTENQVLVKQAGGSLNISITKKHITMSGEAVLIYQGEIDFGNI